MERNISNKYLEELNEIKENVLSGRIKLLDLQLIPIFNKLKNSLTVENLEGHSKAYTDACILLEEKFEELKNLINTSEMERRLRAFLEKEPSDAVLINLFNGAWKKPFSIDMMAFNFLEKSKNLLCRESKAPIEIKHEEIEPVEDLFIVEIMEKDFTVRMMDYYEEVRQKVPCSFNEIFENETNKVNVYKKFVYLMHLIQSGRIKYQEETDFIYVME